ncbi:hypothetical protein TrVGV298_001494 [Trichoderma virens]|nr:hypothetical protein TrVGV298_001494 [Trichoderma virens]
MPESSTANSSLCCGETGQLSYHNDHNAAKQISLPASFRIASHHQFASIVSGIVTSARVPLAPRSLVHRVQAGQRRASSMHVPPLVIRQRAATLGLGYDRHGVGILHAPRSRIRATTAGHPPAVSSFDPQDTLVVLQLPFGFPHASVPDLEILSLPKALFWSPPESFILGLTPPELLPAASAGISSIPFTAWRESIVASACLILSSTRDTKVRKSFIRMDPDCAICHAPASMACDCEAKGLEVAVKQAEERMMRSIYSDIRSWVRGHAQDYILEYFRQLAERRKTAHSAHLDHITAHAFYHYNAPPHPNQIAEAQATLKRGIDEDWQASVQRYPEVLEYFYSLIELTLPADDEAAVKNPPLTAPPPRKPSRRAGSISASAGSAPPPAIAPPSSFHDRDALMERRTPAPPATPRDRRTFRPPPPQHHPSSSYYAPFG